MLDSTFLTSEQVFGENKLDLFNNYSEKSTRTDFCILLGDETSCWWWTKDGDVAGKKGIDAILCSPTVDNRRVAARPAIKYSLIKDIAPVILDKGNGIKEVEFGEYPQWEVCDNKLRKKLDKNNEKGILRTTGKTYTVDYNHKSNDSDFERRELTEYEFEGNKYVSFTILGTTVLGRLQGRFIGFMKYWIKVQPIIWIVDEKADIALSKYSLFSGTNFDNKINYNGYFNDTNIKKFMDNHVSREIVNGLVINNEVLNQEKVIDVDKLFEETINKMNEINEMEKPKILSLK